MIGCSRSIVTGIFDHDCVSLNGATQPDAGVKLQCGDHILVRYEQDRRYSPKHKARQDHRGFRIVYEDREVVVVDKSPELLTVPTERKEPHTLIYRVNEHVRHEGRGRGAFVVHRLDRGVSGLLVFAKTRDIAASLHEQFASHKPERKYSAIAFGSVATDAGEFRSFLATGKSLSRYSTTEEEGGELAVTHFQVEQRFPRATQLSIWLETGRRNQIRVHFAEAGHPVLGDTRYRPDLALPTSWPYRRLALHAASLGFQNPVTLEMLRFTSPLPSEMRDFVRRAEKEEQHPATSETAADSPRSKQPAGKQQVGKQQIQGQPTGKSRETRGRRRKSR